MKIQILMKQSIIFLLFLAVLCSCSSPSDGGYRHEETNGVYYWKTVLAPSSRDCSFMQRHEVGRIYLRMFDVTVEDWNTSATFEKVVPNASVRMPSDGEQSAAELLNAKRVVPVVYVTVEALKAAKGLEGQLASLMVERVRRMCRYYELTSVEGLQIDCDWTVSTEQSFFSLCDSLRSQMAQRGLRWALSSTIRLHQLARKAPPVDYGVLMVYNTGSFSNPDARNSIISMEDVEPYLDRLPAYPLHLDVAYPTYSWQLLFRNRLFVALLNGLNVADTACFAASGKNCHRALVNVIYHGRLIRRGDIVRTEESAPKEVLAVKDAIERRLSTRRHSNILYHLDQKNLSKYTADEINRLYSTQGRD